MPASSGAAADMIHRRLDRSAPATAGWRASALMIGGLACSTVTLCCSIARKNAQIRRRKVLGMLIHEYERAAWRLPAQP